MFLFLSPRKRSNVYEYQKVRRTLFFFWKAASYFSSYCVLSSWGCLPLCSFSSMQPVSICLLWFLPGREVGRLHHQFHAFIWQYIIILNQGLWGECKYSQKEWFIFSEVPKLIFIPWGRKSWFCILVIPDHRSFLLNYIHQSWNMLNFTLPTHIYLQKVGLPKAVLALL